MKEVRHADSTKLFAEATDKYCNIPLKERNIGEINNRKHNTSAIGYNPMLKQSSIAANSIGRRHSNKDLNSSCPNPKPTTARQTEHPNAQVVPQSNSKQLMGGMNQKSFGMGLQKHISQGYNNHRE